MNGRLSVIFKRYLRLLVVGAIAGLAALGPTACGISDPSTNKSEPFTGTVTPGQQGNLYQFSVTKNGGEFNIKITALSPDTGTTLGLLYGQFTSTTECLPINQTPLAGLNKTAFSGPISKGDFCLLVFDNGLNQKAETYTVTVSHP